MARMTDLPQGVQTNKVIMDLLSAEPSGKVFSDGVDYSTRVKSGGTYGSIWMQSDGLHYNVAGVDRTVPLTSTSGSTDLDIAYALGSTISVNAGALTLNDSRASSVNTLVINKTAIGSGNLVDLNYSVADTGNAIDVNMTNNLAGAALNITSAGARTDDLIDIADSSTSSANVFNVALSGVYTGSIFNAAINAAATTGYAINIDLNAGLAYGAIFLDAGNGTRTVDIIDATFDGDGNVAFLDLNCTNTGNGALLDIDVTGVHTGNALDITYGSAASTGNAINVAMGTNVAGAAFYATGAGSRTDSLFELVDASTGNTHLMNIATSGIYTGNLLHLECNTAAATGNIIDIDCDTNLAGNAIYIDCGAGIRTGDLVKVKMDGAGNISAFEVDVTNTGSGDIIDIDVDAVHTGNAVSVTYGTAAATGDAFVAAMGTNVAGSALVITGAGSRTDDLIKIDDSSTGNAHIFDINLTAAYTGNCIDITNAAATVASTALKITSSTGERTVGDIIINDGGTATAPNIDINISGVMTGAALDVTYSSAAATGNAIDLNMGTNVAGNAIDIGSAATGVNNKGSAINIEHTGALVQGGTVVRVDSTSNLANADGNIVEIIQRTGAGQVGNYALYVSASGTNVEALKVDDGNAVFDEQVTVTGALNVTKGVIHGITALSGAGAVSVATPITRVTSTGVGDALTLADGTAGQIIYVVHEVDGGSAVLTPTTKTGFSTITFTAAGDSATLVFLTTRGWCILALNGATAA